MGSYAMPIGGSANNPTGMQGGSNTAMGMPILSQGGSYNPVGGYTQNNTSMPGALPGITSGMATNTSASSSSPGTWGSTGVVQGNTGSVSMMPGLSSSSGTNLDLSQLNSEYGGMGSYVGSLINNGGMNMALLGQVDSSELNAMQGQINQGSANVNATLGAMGVSGNSSTAALANSQYQAGATAQENALINQNYMNMYNEGQSTLQSILPGVLGTTAQNIADQPNWMDYLGLATGLAGSAVGLGSGLGLFSGIGGATGGVSSVDSGSLGADMG
jgi:hypothetical protein